jgi:hypothetical protein
MKMQNDKGTGKRMAGTLIVTAFLATLILLFAAYGLGSTPQTAAAHLISSNRPADHGTPEATHTEHGGDTPEATETEHHGTPEATQTEHHGTPEATETEHQGHTETPEATRTPESTRTHEPEATETEHGGDTRTPEATRTHEPEETEPPEGTETEHPERTHTPEATEPPEGTETPEATETNHPDMTQTPEATETEEGTETPEATHTAESTQTPEATETAEPTQTQIAVRPAKPILPATVPGTGSQTFAATSKTVNGVFLDYWNSNGGLAQQGYPISDMMQEQSQTDGKFYTVQYFERAVFEYHPELSGNNQVLLSLLGVFRYNSIYPNGASGQVADKSGTFFAQTGHYVGGEFLKYWQSHGGLAQQGYPISDEFTEVSPLDGKSYTVQYFERAVFELHPENQAPYNVLLSQLGTFQYGASYGK